MKILIRDDGTWCRIYAGELVPKGIVTEIPDDYQTEEEVDTFVVNFIDNLENK